MSVEASRREDRRFAAILLAWMVVAVVFWLGIARLQELAGSGVSVILLAVFVLAPLALIVRAGVRALRRSGRWISVAVVVVAWVSLVIAGIPLFRVSVYLNFLAHRAAYDAVVADVKLGRLEVLRGRAHGVRYSRTPEGHTVYFPWREDLDVGHGVVYDDVGCPPRAQVDEPPPPSPKDKLPPRSNGADPPTMKNAGRLGGTRLHLADHYCFVSFP